jgi:hypothetical protein
VWISRHQNIAQSQHTRYKNNDNKSYQDVLNTGVKLGRYCDMTPEERNCGARRDGRCYVTADKHVSVTTDTHATIELLGAVFFMRSVPRLYSESRRGNFNVWGLTPERTGRLTVGRNVTLTWASMYEAWHQNGLGDWPSVVMWLWLELQCMGLDTRTDWPTDRRS